MGSSEKYIKTSKCNTWFPRNKTVYIALLNWSQKLSKGWSGEIIVASYVKQEWKTSSMSLQANIAGEVLVTILFFVFSFLVRFLGKLLLYFHAIIDFWMSCCSSCTMCGKILSDLGSNSRRIKENKKRNVKNVKKEHVSTKVLVRFFFFLLINILPITCYVNLN